MSYFKHHVFFCCNQRGEGECCCNSLGATEAQTLKTWTLMETILGTTGAIVGMIAFTLLS